MDNESYKHTTVRLPRSLDRWLRIRAAHLDISKSELVREILTMAVNSQIDMAQHETFQWGEGADDS